MQHRCTNNIEFELNPSKLKVISKYNITNTGVIYCITGKKAPM